MFGTAGTSRVGWVIRANPMTLVRLAMGGAISARLGSDGMCSVQVVSRGERCDGEGMVDLLAEWIG